MTRINLLILLGALAAGLTGYLVIGHPGLADYPMAARQAALADKIRSDPQSLTPVETLSRLEQAIRDKPEAPEPHFFIGEMLRAQGRLDEAMRAYQSAVRRDDAYIPAMIALADALVETGNGAVSPDATRLYARAYQLNETEVRAGMWAAMGAAQAGDQATANQAMTYILSRLPADDPRRPTLEAMVKRLGTAPAPQ